MTVPTWLVVGGIFVIVCMIIWVVSACKGYEEELSKRIGFQTMYQAEHDKHAKAQRRVQELETAISVHMNAQDHQRRWINDLELYRVMDPKFDKMRLALPCLPEFIHNCIVYWRDSQPPETRKLGG